jgi:hypothetical protein
MTPPPTISKTALVLAIVLALLALLFVACTPDFLSGPPVYQKF